MRRTRNMKPLGWRWPGIVAIAWIILMGAPFNPGASEQTAEKPAVSQGAEELRQEMREMIDRARDRVFPALVNIEVLATNYWGGREHKNRAIGSGTILSAEGYILTNAHVVRQGKKFKCTLADQREIDAELIGEDPLTDLAVLKLDLSGVEDAERPLPHAEFGDSDQMRVGDYVMAMGSPLALSRSVTLGIVSNTERVFTNGLGGDQPSQMQLDEGQRTGLFNRWIQHDALIQPGNSGGPLVNLGGEIVGVNARGGMSMGFAIPGNLAREISRTLIDQHEVARSWYGISLRTIEDSGYDEGVLVNSVVEESPAVRAGMRAGDLIVGLEGKPVTIRFPEEIPPLLKTLADRPIGSKVSFEIKREGESIELEVETSKMEKDRGKEEALRLWGLTAIQITSHTAREWRFETTEGALVTGVWQGRAAQLAEPPLGYGDVIRSIDAEPVKSLEDLHDLYEKWSNEDPRPKKLLVEFERRGKDHVTVIEPKEPKDENPPREVAKAWIGVATQPVLKDLAEKLGHPKTLGFRITRVYPKTNAAQTRLKTGDLVTAVNGKELKPRGLEDTRLLEREVRRLDLESSATLTVLREGEPIRIEVPLERTRIKPEQARRAKNRDFELTVRDVTFFDRDENRWSDEVDGVIVEQVESAGWAGLGGIATRDLIQKINGQSITSAKEFRAVMKQIAKDRPERVVFVVLRRSRSQFQFVEPDWEGKAAEDQDREAQKDDDQDENQDGKDA